MVYAIFAVFVIVGSSHGVNMTDGLDGLAIGPVIISAGTFLVLTYAAGTLLAGFDVARYLNIPAIPGVGELALYCGAICGAGIGFLWYNTYPASVFLGDVGGGVKERVYAGDRWRDLCDRGGKRRRPSGQFQTHRETGISYGSDPSPFRAQGMGRAQSDRAFLDHQFCFGLACFGYPQAPIVYNVYFVVEAGPGGRFWKKWSRGG